MRTRAALAFALITAGCGRLDASGLGTDLLDAAPSDSIAGEAFLDDTAPLDTAEAVDTAVADTDSDTLEADAPGPVFCDSSDPDLIACYRFEDAEHMNQPFDESMYAHHGTATGVKYAAGVEGRALVLDKTSTTNVPDAPTLGVDRAITLEAWIKTKNLPAMNRAGIIDENGRYGFFILPDGTLRATAPAQLDAPAVIKTGTWQHVAYTYDGSKQVIYLNGVAIKELAIAGGTFGPGDGAGLAIGMNSPSGDNFEGTIDSVRIFRVARTATQICRAASVC